MHSCLPVISKIGSDPTWVDGAVYYYITTAQMFLWPANHYFSLRKVHRNQGDELHLYLNSENVNNVLLAKHLDYVSVFLCASMLSYRITVYTD